MILQSADYMCYFHVAFGQRQYADIFVTTYDDENVTSTLEFKAKDEHDTFRGDENLKVKAWKLLGLAVAHNTSIHSLNLEFDVIDFDIPIMNLDAKRCIGQFYEGIKQCRSMCTVFLDICPLFGAPVFDLDHLMKHSINLAELKVHCLEPMHSHQYMSLVHALTNNWVFDLELFLDDEDESIEQIVSACSNVCCLEIKSRLQNLHVRSLVTLFKNEESILKCLTIKESNFGSEELSLVAEGLAGNKVLNSLSIQCQYEGEVNQLNTVLCDASSINSIKASNHTLTHLSLTRNEEREVLPLPRFIQDNLELNKNESKEKVVHEKIARYYFEGSFDLTPFVDMPLSTLPRVMTLIQGSSNSRQLAISRLLIGIPELYNVPVTPPCKKLRRSRRLKRKRFSVSVTPSREKLRRSSRLKRKRLL